MVELEYFFVEKVYVDDDYKVSYKYVIGSLFLLFLVEGFKDILFNDMCIIEYEVKFWVVLKFDFFLNWYLKVLMLELCLIVFINSSYFVGEILFVK